MKRLISLGLGIVMSMAVTVLSVHAEPLSAEGRERAVGSPSVEVAEVQAILRGLSEFGGIEFKSENAQVQFEQVLVRLAELQARLEEEASRNNSKRKLDFVVEQLFTVQKIMGAYFGQKDFWGYKLKRGRISLQIDAQVAFEKILEKVPFLGGMGVNGQLQIVADQNVVTQFNALKTAFHGLLIEGAHLDPSDSRIKALAEWATDTKVIYPGESFGVEILTFFEKNDLQLK